MQRNGAAGLKAVNSALRHDRDAKEVLAAELGRIHAKEPSKLVKPAPPKKKLSRDLEPMKVTTS
eukprot:4942748-Pyramimonas_sp.AAC.1